MVRRVSFKRLILAVICFVIIYIFINLQVIIRLGDLQEISTLRSVQSIFELSDLNKNLAHKKRSKPFAKGSFKEITGIPMEYYIAKNYFDKATVIGKKRHDTIMSNNNKLDAVTRINERHDAAVNNIDKKDLVIMKNDKHDAFMRNNNKHSSFMWNIDKNNDDKRNNDKYEGVLRNNDEQEIVQEIGRLINDTKISGYVWSGTKNKTIQERLNQTSRHINGSIYLPLQFIPTNSYNKHRMVPYLSQNITERFLRLPEQSYTQQVAIVSPIRNSEWSLDTFKNQLVSLSYPHRLISVYFGESGSSDKTFEKAANISKVLKTFHHFRECIVVNLQLSGGIHGSVNYRHQKVHQKYRRAHLAKVRNRLVQYVLTHGKFDQVLSIDSDLEEFPSDLVQQMMFAKSDVIVTPCLVKFQGIKYIYDCNSWRETKTSINRQKRLAPDALVLECYGRRPDRIFLSYVKGEGRVVKLDGVGGCALMVRADCFRSGLQFPEVVYKHHIETEGLAKMALDMGFSVVGLPFLEVFHKRET